MRVEMAGGMLGRRTTLLFSLQDNCKRSLLAKKEDKLIQNTTGQFWGEEGLFFVLEEGFFDFLICHIKSEALRMTSSLNSQK